MWRQDSRQSARALAIAFWLCTPKFMENLASGAGPMRLDDEAGSDKIEDRRGMRGGFGFPGGGGVRIPMGRGGGIGIGGILLLLVLWLVFGINPIDILSSSGGFTVPQEESPYQQVPGPQGGGTAQNDAMKA